MQANFLTTLIVALSVKNVFYVCVLFFKILTLDCKFGLGTSLCTDLD